MDYETGCLSARTQAAIIQLTTLLAEVVMLTALFYFLLDLGKFTQAQVQAHNQTQRYIRMKWEMKTKNPNKTKQNNVHDS